jgi:glycosyltransferase involved in cell wall biosynthesis
VTRVAFVNATHRWGGEKSWTLRVGRGLSARGHDIRFFLRAGGDHGRAFREAGLEVRPVTFGFDFNPLAIRSLVRGFRDHGTEVVVTNVSKDNRIAGPAARRLGLPVLQRVGGSGDITDRWRVRLEQRRYVDRIVVPARSIRDRLRRFPWMGAEDRVTVIPNGVDLERFRPGVGAGALRRELGTAPEVALLATTVQLAAIKGLDVLLAAMASLDRTDLVLALIGRGKEEPDLRRRAAALGMEGRVRFLGFRADVHLLLEDADVVVHPSIAGGEGLPNSVIECLAKGKALVATGVGGVPEAVDDGVEGLLVPPGDPGALAGALARLLEDPALRERLGRAARLRAEREFGDTLMVGRLEALLEGMAS